MQAVRTDGKRAALAPALPPPGQAAEKRQPPARSCLDGLWEAVSAGASLRARRPIVLAHTLQVLLAMWQARELMRSDVHSDYSKGHLVELACTEQPTAFTWRLLTCTINQRDCVCPLGVCRMCAMRSAQFRRMQAESMAWRAVELLRQQPGFWEAVAGCLPDKASDAEPSGHSEAEEEDADEALGDPARGGDAAWRLAIDAAVLQLLSLEAFAQPRSPDGEAFLGTRDLRGGPISPSTFYQQNGCCCRQ